MNNSKTIKETTSGLSEVEQDAIAIKALSEMKTRSRLEHVAESSVWTKLGWVVPILFSMVIIGLASFGKGGNLSDLLPIIVVWLLIHIQGLNMQVNSRIDAIYRIMKEDRDSTNARIKDAEQGTAPNP